MVPLYMHVTLNTPSIYTYTGHACVEEEDCEEAKRRASSGLCSEAGAGGGEASQDGGDCGHASMEEEAVSRAQPPVHDVDRLTV